MFFFQSVHDSTPPSKNYKRLETLVSYIVSPYLSSTGIRIKPITHPATDDNLNGDSKRIPRPASALQLSKPADKLDPVLEVEHFSRRHTITGSDDSVFANQDLHDGSVPSNASSSKNVKDYKM